MERDELIREVVEAFDDTGALLVLADRLQLAGDPIGELIALQAVPGKVTRKRMLELERAVRERWLGPLVEIVDPVHLGFSRGIPSRFVLRRKARQLVVDDPLWSLVETLDLDRSRPRELHAVLARMPRLRRLEGALPAVVAELRGPRRPPSLVSLGCYLGARRTAAGYYVTGGLDRAAADALREAPLVELRHGDHFEAGEYRWLWTSELAPRLARLSASNINHRHVWGPLALGAWWRELQDAPPALEQFELTEHDNGDFEPDAGWCLRFRRDARGQLGAVHAHYTLGRSRIMDPHQRLAGGLAELAPRSLASFVLEGTAEHVRRSDSYAQVVRQIKRLRCEADLR